MALRFVAMDMAGVIFTEGHIIRNILCKMFPDVGYTELRKRYERYIIGDITNEQFWSGITARPKIAEREFFSRLRLDPDLKQVIAYLKKKYTTVILSDCPREWKGYVLSEFGLKALFAFAFTSSDFGCSKPGRDFFEAFLKRVGVKGEECAYIDDRLDSLETAKTLGFTTIWYRKEPPLVWYKPDHVISRLSEVMRIL